jgi:hypothetical protein
MNDSQYCQSRRWLALLSCGTVFCSALVAPNPKAFGQVMLVPLVAQNAKPVPMQASPPRSVIAAIRLDLMKTQGISQAKVISFSVQPWPDSCLGLPKPKENCASGSVPDWRVEVSDGLQTWFYRTDTTGKIIRVEEPERAILPQQVARKLIQQVARGTRIPAEKLKIAAVKPANFDGCLGIYRPNQACTKILIAGWQAIIVSPQNTFVYHLSRDAARIAQNDTASGANRKINVSFELFGGSIPALESKVIFQSMMTGSLMGTTTTISLTEDGKITEFTTDPMIRSRPVVRKTLTPTQLKNFRQALQNHRFRNFNQLSYLTSAAFADYPTTTYQSQDCGMQFIDLEKTSLPPSLQRVIGIWNNLIRP